LKTPALRQTVGMTGAITGAITCAVLAADDVCKASLGLITMRSGSICSFNRNDSFFDEDANPHWLRRPLDQAKNKPLATSKSNANKRSMYF
jgi:hypothetical protein